MTEQEFLLRCPNYLNNRSGKPWFLLKAVFNYTG